MSDYFGIFSIILVWFGLLFLIKKWPGDRSLTFSQHAARREESIIFYFVLWAAVLPLFYWFMVGPFSDTVGLGTFFKIFVTFSSLCMLGAAIVPETKGWRVLWHRIFAYAMAYSLCPIVFIILIQGDISKIAQVVILASSLVMLVGVVKSIVEKRSHGTKTLPSQAAYIALFHLSVLVAYYF